MNLYLINDTFLEENDVKINPQDRGYCFGDGAYEVCKVYNTQLFTLQEHVDRFYLSCAKIKINIPYTKEKLIELLKDLVAKNQVGTGHIYWQITRGVSHRNHLFPAADVQPVLMAWTKENARPVANFENGVKAWVVEDKRWLMCDIKSLNLLGAVLAKQEAHEHGCYEAVLHRDGVVTECSSSNFFGIKNGTLFTHPANNLVLHGITRAVILQCAQDIGMPVKEEAFTLEQMYEMDEAIISSTTSEVTPCIAINDKPVGTGQVGEWTRKLQKQFDTKIPQ